MDEEELKQLVDKYTSGLNDPAKLLEDFDLNMYLEQIESTGHGTALDSALGKDLHISEGNDFSSLGKTDFGLEGTGEGGSSNLDAMLRELNLEGLNNDDGMRDMLKDITGYVMDTVGSQDTPVRKTEERSTMNMMIDTPADRLISRTSTPLDLNVIDRTSHELTNSKSASPTLAYRHMLSPEHKRTSEFEHSSELFGLGGGIEELLRSLDEPSKKSGPNSNDGREPADRIPSRGQPVKSSKSLNPDSGIHSGGEPASPLIAPQGVPPGRLASGSNMGQLASGISHLVAQSAPLQGISRSFSLNPASVPAASGVQTPSHKPRIDDGWVTDMEKKIRLQEVEHIHSNFRLNVPTIRQIAQQKNRGIRKKEEIVIEKGREFRLDSNSTSPFKRLLDRFDSMEMKTIKEIKRKRDTNFYSALRECSWNSSSLSSVTFDKGQHIQDIIKGQYAGSLTCFAFSVDYRSLLVIGTDQGEVLEIDLMQRKLRKQKVDNKVLSIDVSPDREKWIAGLDNGEIYVKKTYGAWTSKRQKVDEKPINQIRFASNDLAVIASDFNVHKIVIKDLKVIFDVTRTYILHDNRDKLIQLSITQFGKISKVIVASVTTVRLYTLKEEDSEEEFLVERPEYVRAGSVPSVSWLSPDDKKASYILVFWDSFVLLIQDEGSNSSVCAMKQLNQKIIWGCVLRNRVICVIFDDFEVNLFSIQSIFVNLLSGGGFEAKFKLTKSEYTKARNLDVTSEGNITQSWSEAIRCYDNNVFFLKSDGVFKMYLMSLKEMAYAYAEKGEWLPAFKLCVEVCDDRIRANYDEKKQMKTEITILANTYVDRFMDKSKKADDIQSKIMRICIDAMVSSENEEYLFNRLRHKFEEISFWREIEHFIEHGLISRIPVNALKDGGLYLQSDSLQHIVYELRVEDLLASEEQFNQLIGMLKRRKLWASLYRLGLMQTDTTLGLIYSSMMAELMAITGQEAVKQKIVGFSPKNEEDFSEFFEDPKMCSYFRLFWYLHKIVTWNVSQIYDKNSIMEEVWVKTIEWLLDPSNIKVLSTTNISLYLEIYFDLFLNVDFTTSEKVSENLSKRVEMIRQNMPDQQVIIKADTHPNTDSFYVFKAILEALFQFCDPKYTPDVSFLALKLVTLSVFKQLVEDTDLVTKLVRNLLGEPFVGERLWFHFESISKEDYEEQIIRMLTTLRSHSKDYFAVIESQVLIQAKTNGFFRVYCFLVDLKHGPIEAFLQYISLVDYGNPIYLFNWIRRKLVEIKNEQDKIAFSRVLIEKLDYLIGKNKTKAKEIVIMIPNVGIDSIENLE